MMTLEINPPRHDRRETRRGHVASRNLVLVASEPALDRGGSLHRGETTEPSRSQRILSGPNGLKGTRVAAHTVGVSAAWCRRRAGQIRVSPWSEDPIGPAPGRVSSLPQDLAGILSLLEQEEISRVNGEAIAEGIVALRAADAVVVGPLSPDDANAPGLLPHLADLTPRAYRALRPPRELIVHPAIAQVARRFQFIQMTSHEARAMCAGASDLGILAQQLRRLQGEPGELAITAFGSHGLLWADNAWWEIEPIGDGDVNESLAGAVFCMAWVVARRFRGADAREALTYALAVTDTAMNSVRKNRTRFPLG
jgi:hypothetical protein